MQSEKDISEDEKFLVTLQEIVNAFGEDAEIEMDTHLFWRLVAINCPKKVFY